MTSWETWAAGVLAGIGASVDAVNVDTLWAWSNAETAPYDLMRWKNPMNTTEPWPGARDSGAQPGPHDVKIYASLNDGILATVATLENGFYSAILVNLRASLPRQQWGAYSTAGAELHAWGTGTNWLQSTYGPAPGDIITIGGFGTMTDDEINAQFNAVSVKQSAIGSALQNDITAATAAIVAAVKAVQVNVTTNTLSPAQQAQLQAAADAAAAALAGVERIEAALKAA